MTLDVSAMHWAPPAHAHQLSNTRRLLATCKRRKGGTWEAGHARCSCALRSSHAPGASAPLVHTALPCFTGSLEEKHRITYVCPANGAGPCRPFCIQQLLGALGTDGSMAAGNEDLLGGQRADYQWGCFCWGLGA